MNQKEIYGWHIIHVATGFPYAFCSRVCGKTILTEEDALGDLDPEQFTLVPLVRAGELQ